MVVIGGILVAMVAVLMLLFASAFGGCLAPHGDDFDSGAWRSADPGSACSARYDMVDDLLAHHLSEGMTRTEVVDLLGEGVSDEAIGMAGSEVGDLLYQTGCGIDCFWVVVEFDADDRLTEARRSSD